MKLFGNPFYLLGISPRDTRQRIVEVCDLKSLEIAPDTCSEAKTILITPRSRLVAEIAWLPGISPARSLELINKIKSEPQEVANSMPGIDPLARCNLAAGILETTNFKSHPDNLAKWILYLAEAFEEVDEDAITDLINEDRQISRFPLVQDSTIVIEEIGKHRGYLISIMKDSLNKIEDPDVIMTKIVEKATSGGEDLSPILIEELVELYQVEVQKYLDKMTKEVYNLMKKMKATSSTNIASKVELLEKKVKSWKQIAQPIHLVMQSKGVEDEQMHGLARGLRDLNLFLANEHDLHVEAKRLSKLMIEIFKELPEFLQIVQEDIEKLNEIIHKKAERVSEEIKWRKEISLDVEIGSDKLSISGDYISYKGRSIRTQDVNRVKWGVYKHYVNGVRTNREYTIWVGNSNEVIKIECVRLLEREATIDERYNLIVGKLWKAVCIRLVGDTLSRLSSGEKIRYGDIIVDQKGIMLRKHKFLGTDPFYCGWRDMSKGNGSGVFCINSTKEKKVYAQLSYRDIDNVHILEAVMNYLWQDGNYERLERGEFR